MLDNLIELTEPEREKPFRLFDHFSSEGWKKRIISRRMTLLPLRFISKIEEEKFVGIRQPLLQNRAKILTVYHLLSTLLCTTSIAFITYFNNSDYEANEWATHIAFVVLQMIMMAMLALYSCRPSSFSIEVAPHWFLAGVRKREDIKYYEILSGIRHRRNYDVDSTISILL